MPKKGTQTGIYRNCNICETLYYVRPALIKTSKYCSKKCHDISQIGQSSWNKGLTKENNEIIRTKCSGKPAWNRGLNIHNNECMRKMAEKQRGRKLDPDIVAKRKVPLKGKTYEEYYGEEKAKKLRKNLRLKAIEFNKINNVNFNKLACSYFELLNDWMHWHGKHAMNGGEYHIKELGYWLDYYEPEVNIVIEWDEHYHFNKDGTLKEYDIKRQKEIEEFLGCHFERINQSTCEFKKPKRYISNIILPDIPEHPLIIIPDSRNYIYSD